MSSLRTKHRIAHKIALTYKSTKYCNWCGKETKGDVLVHHGDENPDNNDLDNLWILCGRKCHLEVHEKVNNSLIHSKGGAKSQGGFRQYHRLGNGTVEYSEEQRRKGRLGTGEVKARGARVSNAKRVECPDCGRVMNPGSLGMHKRVHVGGGQN